MNGKWKRRIAVMLAAMMLCSMIPAMSEEMSTQPPVMEEEAIPTEAPEEAPTEVPEEVPTEAPTEAPTEVPAEAPVEVPTEVPTEAPTEVPTEAPTEVPTEAPTEVPTEAPTEVPTEIPTEAPAEGPTEASTEAPTEAPTEVPSEAPTEVPTETPTEEALFQDEEPIEFQVDGSLEGFDMDALMLTLRSATNCKHEYLYIDDVADGDLSYEINNQLNHTWTRKYIRRELICGDCYKVLQTIEKRWTETSTEPHDWYYNDWKYSKPIFECYCGATTTKATTNSCDHEWLSFYSDTRGSNEFYCVKCATSKTFAYPCGHRELDQVEDGNAYCPECGAVLVLYPKAYYCTHSDIFIWEEGEANVYYVEWDEKSHLKDYETWYYDFSMFPSRNWRYAECVDCGQVLEVENGKVRYVGLTDWPGYEPVNKTTLEPHTMVNGKCSLCGYEQTVVRPTISSVTATQSMNGSGAAVAAFTVKTSTSASSLKLCSESGAVVKTFTSGYTDANGVRTWKVSYTFANDGARQLSFVASGNGTDSAAYQYSITLTGVQVKSAKFNAASVNTGAAAQATIVTDVGANYLHMYSEDGTLIKTWSASGYSSVSGGARTWTVSYAFGQPGVRTMTFKASRDGKNPKTGKTAKITVNTSTAVTSASCSHQSITAMNTMTFTVKTTTDANYLKMYSENGGLVKTWTASGNSTVSGSTRVWTLKYAFANAGDRTVTFKASANGTTMSAGRSVSVKILALPAVTSAVSSHDTITAMNSLTFTVQTPANGYLLSLCAEGGGIVKTWNTSYSTVSGNVRTWKVPYTFVGAGNRVVTLQATADGKNYGAGKQVKVNVLALPAVTSAVSSHNTITAKNTLTFTVKTSTNGYLLSLYAEGGNIVKTWNTSYSTVSGNVRTWKVPYTFVGAGNRTVTLKASADGKNYGAGKQVKVNVLALPAVTSAVSSHNTITAKNTLTFTVKTPANGYLLSLYAEGGGIVKTWNTSYSTVSGNVRTWKVPYTFVGAGNRVVTLKASAGGSHYGTGQQVKVNVLALPAVTSAVFSPSTVSRGETTTIVAYAPSNGYMLHMFLEDGKLYRTWNASQYATKSGSGYIYRIPYTFTGAGSRRITFKSSADGKNFGTGKTVSITVK